MCWSAEVSWAFASLDLVFIGVLLCKRHRNGVYIAFLCAIAAQEWAQYFLWRRGHLLDEALSCSTATDVALSLTASLSAQSVPLTLIGGALYYDYGGGSYAALNKERSTRIAWEAFGWWLSQFVILTACVIYSGKYCVTVGPNHHQVWICASAVYEVGRYPLYFLSLFQYIMSAGRALWALPLPTHERQWILGIALTNGFVAYGIYSWTLEACSIWCWSAFSFGIYFCVKDWL